MPQLRQRTVCETPSLGASASDSSPDTLIQIPLVAETCGADVGSDRPFGCARRFDVASDLLDEFRLAPERLFLAQPLPQLDDEPFSVEIALEVEQEGLDATLVAAVVRVCPDRDGRTVRRSGPRVDAERGHEQAWLDPEV